MSKRFNPEDFMTGGEKQPGKEEMNQDEVKLMHDVGEAATEITNSINSLAKVANECINNENIAKSIKTYVTAMTVVFVTCLTAQKDVKSCMNLAAICALFNLTGGNAGINDTIKGHEKDEDDGGLSE